jgi:REP element-mobilizing transposase RayT
MPLRGRTQFDKIGNTYFVTTTVMNFDRIFSLGRAYNLILMESMKYLLKRHKAQLYAYVIMPNHFHMVSYMPQGESIVDFMRNFKRHTSTEIRKLAEAEKRFYLLERFRSNAEYAKMQSYKVWIDRFDDLIITTQRTVAIKVNYIHFNPVKAGLAENPEEWEFSSARNYYLNDHSLIRTDWSID